MIDKHSYEQVHLKGFSYKFLNSADPLYLCENEAENLQNGIPECGMGYLENHLAH